jgi:hypothetical protein
MSFYRNVLLAAAFVPAVILSIPKGNPSDQSQPVTNYRNSEIQYRKIAEPTSQSPITPEDYEIAVWQALGSRGVAPLREVEGYNPVILTEALMETESGRGHYDQGGMVKRGGSGEVGIMQVMPYIGEAACGMSVEELAVLDNNVECGMIYLSDALVTCRGNVEGALTNYHRGSSGQCMPSYYSEDVLKNYRYMD